ncbi:MAG: ABC transporter permease [bacterium]
MFQFFKNLYEYRELLYALSGSYIKARYKQTILGVGWALVQPLVLMLTIIFVFPQIANISQDMMPYSLFVFIGFWIWTLFANSLAFSIPNLVQNTALLRKVYFPREILVVSAILPNLLDFCIGILVLIIFMIYFSVPINISFLLLPFLLIIFMFFTLGIALLGSVANVAFRDVSKFLPIGLQILFFATPIIYSFNNVNSAYVKLYKINPLTGVIDGFRSIIMHGTIDHPLTLVYALIFSIIVFYIGYFTFKKGEQIMADII